jgi:diaminopimelate epimerase
VSDLVWIEGAGNRFALHDTLVHGSLVSPAAVARELADDARRPDGLLVLDRDPGGAVRMTIYNRDGSRPEACGNGLRCVARAAVDAGHSPRGEVFPIATDAGTRQGLVDARGATRVSMGVGRRLATHVLEVDGERLEGIECDLGNPHLVLARPALLDEEIARLGPRLERDPRFPRGTNVEFVTGGGTRFAARVWERGVGETAACGTGACAIALALATELPAEVVLPGGTLTVDRDGDELWLAGPVTVERELP